MRNLDMESMPTREPINKTAQVKNGGLYGAGKGKPSKATPRQLAITRAKHARAQANRNDYLDNGISTTDYQIIQLRQEAENLRSKAAILEARANALEAEQA